ncbi:thioredoxin-like protein [Mycena amicta]|nr:thioredoxin-like protein [Mycena amicta]
MEPKRPSLTTRFRRRRIFVGLFVLIALVYWFGFPTLDAFELDFPVNRANLVQLVRSKGKSGGASAQVPEIYGLLHLVTSHDTENEHILAGTDGFDPTKPVDMQVYAAGKRNVDWDERKREIDQRFPLVVFSKTYCPYSKRAKTLLESYRLSPPPKVIEVDLRDDAEHLKQLLTRLTHHATFPNINLLGTSLGGSDQLQGLHHDGRLRRMLEDAGMVVGNADV